jgi:transposase
MKSKKIFSDVKIIETEFYGQVLQSHICCNARRDPNNKRFSTVGDYASYCRCVGSQKLSNGKKKGKGNTKNGNKYLAWAFVEAANFAIRYNARIKSFYQRKKARSHGVLAIKAVAHKLCRACYYIVKDQVAFDVAKAFAG